MHLQDLNIILGFINIGYSLCGLAGRDALVVTVLTGLTRLRIDAVGGVDDVVVCAFAASLTKLQHLSVPWSEVSIAPLPGLGLLTSMQHLTLKSYDKSDAELGLHFLTRLHQLTHLGGFDSAGQQALNAFWDVVRGRQVLSG